MSTKGGSVSNSWDGCSSVSDSWEGAFWAASGLTEDPDADGALGDGAALVADEPDADEPDADELAAPRAPPPEQAQIPKVTAKNPPNAPPSKRRVMPSLARSSLPAQPSSTQPPSDQCAQGLRRLKAARIGSRAQTHETPQDAAALSR